MTLVKALITVKTYPTLSTKYDELVCTAGFREDGSWIRLYPLPFRKLDYSLRYKKYQWVELDVTKYEQDPRPESYRPTNYEKMKVGEVIDTDNGLWSKRKDLVLGKVYTNLDILIAEAKDRNICTSLAVFKPKAILDFKIEPETREWDPKKLAVLAAKAAQGDLFSETVEAFKVVNKLPYKFSYTFTDETDKPRTLMIEDWEIGQLYWNCLNKYKDEPLACAAVRAKYMDDFAKTKDLHFYLGTTRQFHFIAPNPFIIIGTFHPKHPPLKKQLSEAPKAQLSLF